MHVMSTFCSSPSVKSPVTFRSFGFCWSRMSSVVPLAIEVGTLMEPLGPFTVAPPTARPHNSFQGSGLRGPSTIEKWVFLMGPFCWVVLLSRAGFEVNGSSVG